MMQRSRNNGRIFPAQQRGVTLIAVVLFLAIVSAAVISSLDSAGSNVWDSKLMADRVKAFYIAESAVEYAVKRFNNGVACTGLAPDGPIVFGDGTVSLTNSVVTVAPHCVVTFEATVNNLTQIIEVDVAFVTGVNGIVEPFLSQADFNAHWTPPVISPTANDGSSDWDIDNCPATVCATTIAGSGSMWATTTSGTNLQYSGYHRRTLNPPLATGAAGLQLTMDLGYTKDGSTKKNWGAGGKPNGQGGAKSDMFIDLYDSAKGTTTTVWSDTQTKVFTWKFSTANINLPPNMNYDEVRIRFDIKGTAKTFKFAAQPAIVGWDHLRIFSPAGAGSTTIFNWSSN